MEVAQHWRVKAQRFNLKGTICGNCESVHFPPREICPNCAANLLATEEAVALKIRQTAIAPA